MKQTPADDVMLLQASLSYVMAVWTQQQARSLRSPDFNISVFPCSGRMLSILPDSTSRIWMPAVVVKQKPAEMDEKISICHGLQILDSIVPELAIRQEEEERRQKAAAKLRLQLDSIIPDDQGGFGRYAAHNVSSCPGAPL